MYIQVTTKCNMSCPHCCYNCTAKGEDMSLDTFRTALDLCEDTGSVPFIGGGEPTLHPQFEQMLLEAIGTASAIDEGVKVGVITNGSLTRKAKMIASLTKGGVIYGEVSQDQYHDQIDSDVIQAFTDAYKHTNANRYGWNQGVRDTSIGGSRDPMPHGRAKTLLGWDEDEYADSRDEGDCPCEDHLIQPDGTIVQCGCEDSPIIGSVEEGLCSPSTECFHSRCFIDRCLEDEEKYGHLLVY